MSTEPELVVSPLSRTVTKDERSVEVQIYRIEPGQWVLEAVDEFQNSTVWDDQFDTDQQALDELMRTIADDGIGALIGEPAN
ncbi:MAG: hypothetical protein IT482_10500 [Gammaproteobacteria bacterium]|jgi:division protein CdvB (Snf7/Vps24/ESCRT-III family)|nr:hypothetical protein [Gammaproteobacteria bacterium]